MQYSSGNLLVALIMARKLYLIYTTHQTNNEIRLLSLADLDLPSIPTLETLGFDFLSSISSTIAGVEAQTISLLDNLVITDPFANLTATHAFSSGGGT